jgi:hypothetical protein
MSILHNRVFGTDLEIDLPAEVHGDDAPMLYVIGIDAGGSPIYAKGEEDVRNDEISPRRATALEPDARRQRREARRFRRQIESDIFTADYFRARGLEMHARRLKERNEKRDKMLQEAQLRNVQLGRRALLD